MLVTMLIPSLLAIAAPPPTSTPLGSVWELTVKGGIVMIPIALCSLIAVAVAAERLISLRRARVIPPGFLESVGSALAADPARAREICRAAGTPIARVCLAALSRWDRPIEQIEKHVTETGQREAMILRKNLRVLAVITAVSPLLGLLGTIFGMITAFQTVATSAEALGRTELLAEGIYEAMVTTAAGLIVAIPSLLAYHWLVARVDRLVLDLDAACIELVERRVDPRAREIVAPAAPSAPPEPSVPLPSGAVPA